MKLKLPVIFFICLNMILCASPQKKAEKVKTQDPQYQYNIGLFYLNDGNIDEAIKYLHKAISLNPNYDHALCSLGLAYSMKGNFEESVRHLKKCLSISPNLTEAHNYLGVAYQEMGLIDEAEKEFRIAVLDINYKSRNLPYYNLSRLYLTKGNLQEALNYVEKSLEISNNFRMAHNLKGIILERLLRYEEAIESYKKALMKLEGDVNINFNLAVAYFKNSELEKAKEIFKKIYPKVTDPEMREKIDQYLRILK